MGKKERVLVIEDSDLVMDLLEDILSPYMEIDRAIDGVEALEKLDSGEKYDIIITNHIMPRMEGEEFIEKVRERLPSIPIVAFTYDGWGDSLVKAGADLLIPKPFNPLWFIRAVRRLLGYNDSDDELIMGLARSYDR